MIFSQVVIYNSVKKKDKSIAYIIAWKILMCPRIIHYNPTMTIKHWFSTS